MRPLGPNQRRLLESLVDGRPLAGEWSQHKLDVTVRSLMARGMVRAVQVHVGPTRMRVDHVPTELGLATAGPASLRRTAA
jgi:hypothetical protein